MRTQDALPKKNVILLHADPIEDPANSRGSIGIRVLYVDS